MNDKAFVALTDSLSRSLQRLFNTGGFALAFGFAGLILILAANFGGELKVVVFAAGCLLTFSCLVFFMIMSFRTRQIAKRVKDDLPLLDTLQEVALQLSDFASLTQSYVFKHISRIQRTIETVAPLIESLPFIGTKAKGMGLTDAARISSVVVDATNNAQTVIRGLDDAIRSGDVKAIKSYAVQLDAAIKSLKAALKANEF